MVGGQAAVKPILMLLYGVAALVMLVACSEIAVSVDGQQSLGQCLGRCGQDAFACITGCASEGQQYLASCIGCLTTCAAHINPAPPPSNTPTHLPDPNTSLHK